MPTPEQDNHGWFYNNSVGLILALVIFLSNFVFTDFVNKDKQMAEDFKKLNVQVAELNASIRPIIASFNAGKDYNYTSVDADRDNKRVQQQLDEVKVMVRQNQTTLLTIQERISKVEAKF